MSVIKAQATSRSLVADLLVALLSGVAGAAWWLDSTVALSLTISVVVLLIGIRLRTLKRILAHYATTHGPLAQLKAQLIEFDLPPRLAQAIHERYGDEALDMMQRRPYHLARDVRGIGFLTADRIARCLGIAADSDERAESGLMHVLEKAESAGQCGVPIETLVERVVRALGVKDRIVRLAGERLLTLGDLVLEQGDCVMSARHLVEWNPDFDDGVRFIRSAARIERPPGYRASAALRLLFGPRAFERVFGQIIASAYEEWVEAAAEGNKVELRRVQLHTPIHLLIAATLYPLVRAAKALDVVRKVLPNKKV